MVCKPTEYQRLFPLGQMVSGDIIPNQSLSGASSAPPTDPAGGTRGGRKEVKNVQILTRRLACEHKEAGKKRRMA